MARRVLMVCLGNICRSPTAEAVLRAMAADRRVALTVDSAGTADWNVGRPPHAPAVRAAAARGYAMDGLRARQVRGADFHRFDLILAMDGENRAALERLRPPGSAVPVRLLLDHAPQAGCREVPDPYFTGDFDAALELVEAGCAGLLDRLAAGDGPSQRNA